MTLLFICIGMYTYASAIRGDEQSFWFSDFEDGRGARCECIGVVYTLLWRAGDARGFMDGYFRDFLDGRNYVRVDFVYNRSLVYIMAYCIMILIIVSYCNSCLCI